MAILALYVLAFVKKEHRDTSWEIPCSDVSALLCHDSDQHGLNVRQGTSLRGLDHVLGDLSPGDQGSR